MQRNTQVNFSISDLISISEYMSGY